MLKGFFFLLFMGIHAAYGQEIELDWSVFHPVKKEWLELGKKGSVQEMLISSGELSDPFYGTNENKFGWIENYKWEFKSIFTIDSAMLSQNFIDALFPSLDTYASVYVNDSLVAKTENAFIPHEIDVKPHLKLGVNEIQIVFVPPVLFNGDRWETEKYHLPAPNDVHDTAIAPYTRKPQYQFGWDWSLRMNTIGLNKIASIVGTQNGRVQNKTVRVLMLDVEEKEAIVQFQVKLSNKKLKSIVWESELFGTKEITGGDGYFYFEERISDPKLWWPRGFGEQNIYTDRIAIYTSLTDSQSLDKQILDVFDLNFGIKKSELVREADEWGTSYYFKINGERIFCKGANYIPQDIFPAKVEDKEIVKMVQNMVDANFNMVRVWGGGYYPDDVFFDECDKQGIMVWQDLMFACAMYPGWADFVDNVANELEWQVPRIAAHPSVMLFNGNNEVEVAWGNWGFQIKYGLYGESAREIERAYDVLFKETGKNIVAESMIPYIHTSPLSNWGKSDFYNHGSQHYWGVWHGKDPMEDFGKKIGRFNAEYGFQSFPEYSTLRSFSAETDWDINSEVMKHHQKSYVGNDMILKHAKRLYGKPASFEEFVYFSQLTQAKAVSMAIAGHRVDSPRCGGTLVWQLNDCWPVSSWSSIDYFGNWKALQYRMREDYADATVVAKYNGLDDVDYFLLSDLPGEHMVVAKYSVFDLKGKRISSGETGANLKMDKELPVSIDLMEKKCRKKNDRHIKFEIYVDDVKVGERTFDEINSDKKFCCEKDISIKLVEVDEEAKTAVIELDNRKFVRDLWISSEVFGVRFSNNFQSYLPGIHRIEIDFQELPNVEQFKLMWN